MPYLKCISIRSTVARSLKYILDPEKTDGLLHTGALNCLNDAEDAYLNMKLIYEQFGRGSFDEPPPKQGKAHVKAIHYIQSFDPKDNISPEVAFKIGALFIKRAFGDKCQAVIATHIDKGHIHNHIIVNSYGIDGRKFYANKKTLNELKNISDRCATSYGIMPFDKSKGKRKSITRYEWENEQRGTSWKQHIRAEIDRLIGYVKNVDELLAELEMLGYTVRRGKYISVKAPEQQRAVRLKTLGVDYEVEQLASRILWAGVGVGLTNPCKFSDLRVRYSETITEIKEHTKNATDLQTLFMTLTVISRDNLRSIGEVEGKITQLEREIAKAKATANEAAAHENYFKSLLAQAKEFFTLSDKPQRTAEEEARMQVYKATLERQKITSPLQLDYLRKTVSEATRKTTPVKERFERCIQLYGEYTRISKTYEEISKGDYISKLVEKEQRKRDAQQSRPRR